MKYKLFGLFFIVLFMFGFSSIAHGYIINRGGGLYYNTVTGENTNTPDGSCGAAGEICSTTTDDFAAQMKAAADAKILEDIKASGGSESNMGSCTSEILTNQAAAQACTDKAQAQARARGYDATCAVEKTNFPSSGVNFVTGLNYYFQSTCTIDGSAGHGAYLLVGFDAAPACNSTQLARINSVASFISEGCSNALVNHINPGWDTLAYELEREKTCGLTATCAVPGATNIKNPNNINLLNSLSSAGGGGTGNANTGSGSLGVTSSSGSSPTLSSADRAVAAINAQVNQEQTKYINQISQIVNSMCGTGADCKNLNDLYTQLYQIGSSYTKPIFTTNASGIMHVGDVWNITVTGLNPGETIYATGGKIINGVVPTDKTPYTANGLGIFFQTGTHEKEVIGNWKIVWTRADGTALGTMVFSVAEKVIATTPVVSINTTNPLGNGGQTCSLTASCNINNYPTDTVTSITPTDGTYAGGQTLSRTRYVRIETTEVGWVSWKEIEIYDNAGNKLTPTKVDASVGRWQPAGQGADKLIDGTETPWNAGETVPSTNDCQGPTGCVGLSRSAFAQIDLGSIKNIGKIKLQQNGDTGSEVTKVFISANPGGFTQVAEFKAPMRSGEWLEYPYPVQTGTPSVVLLVNGVSDSTINRGDPIVFSWDVQNADIATSSVSSVVTKAPSDDFGSCPLDPFVHGVSSWLGTEQAQIQLSSRNPNPESPWTWISNWSFLQGYYNCLMGKDYTITLKGKQRYSGRETQTSVVLRIKASAESPNQFGFRNENVIFTSNTYEIMYVGSPWNITISGLNPNEAIYATGGKKVGGVVPTDKTPYVANNLGTFTKNIVFRDGDIGDWQLVWTRADGSNLRTLNFRVLSAPTTIPSVISGLTPSSGPVGASVTITGTGFSPTANTIKFGPYSFFDVPSSNNGTTLTFNIPSQVFNNCRPADTLCLQSSGTAMNTIPGGTYGVTVTNASGTSSAVTFVVAQNPEINPTPTTSNLQLGSTGQAVRDLQRILGITEDGIFGPNTRAAVIEYQQKNGLVADGVVGPATRAKLATNPPVLTTTPTAQPTITRLTPSSGPIGTSVTITGTGFSTTANTIKFSSYSFFDVPSSNNGTTLTFTVPSQIWNNCRSTDYMCFQTQPAARTTIPGTYNVTVTNTNGTSNEVEFTVTQNVTIQPVSPTPISLLYNPGPSYIAGKTIVNDTSKTAVTAPWVSIGTSLAQAFLVGNPSGLCPQGLQGINVEGASNTPASNGACESYYNDTRFWWKSSEWKQWPGWDVHVAGNGNGTPLELFYANHAYPLSQCTQQSREVGIAFDGSSSIKPNMNLGQFKTVTGTFDLNISAQSINPTINCPNGYEAPFQNVTDPWAYVSGDFRVNYFNPDGTWVRGDIFSVHVYNAQAVANKDIFWQGSTCTVNPSNNQYGCTVMINPSAADVSSSAISPGGGYKTFSINFKELYKKYVTPPPGFTTDDAVVGGYDVYSSVRGVDMNFSLKNINLVGTK